MNPTAIYSHMSAAGHVVAAVIGVVVLAGLIVWAWRGRGDAR